MSLWVSKRKSLYAWMIWSSTLRPVLRWMWCVRMRRHFVCQMTTLLLLKYSLDRWYLHLDAWWFDWFYSWQHIKMLSFLLLVTRAQGREWALLFSFTCQDPGAVGKTSDSPRGKGSPLWAYGHVKEEKHWGSKKSHQSLKWFQTMYSCTVPQQLLTHP